LERSSGADLGADTVEAAPWRAWVDGVVDWAAVLLGDLAAAALLRRPDLLAPVADLHRAELLRALTAQPA
jgi:hypothetical protein